VTLNPGTLFAVRLDASSKFVEDQAVAGKLRVDIANSNPAAGTVAESHVEIPAGVSSAFTEFRPAGEGQTTLSAGVPSSFVKPAEFASIIASVKVPGMAISEQLAIGRNLQVSGVLSLGEAPMKVLKVTLVSDDPSRLLLSPAEDQVGSKSITVEFPPGEVSRRYYLQALGDSGTIQYTASAPGYRGRTGTIILAPAGIVITPISQGPPDEAHVFRTEAPESSYKFMAELSKPTPINLVAWTVQLDPVTHRSADITVQPLRAGLSLTVPLMNSNPAVGTVDRQLVIAGGSDHAVGEFKPAKPGETHISVTTPKDFTMSANSTTVIGIVKN